MWKHMNVSILTGSFYTAQYAGLQGMGGQRGVVFPSLRNQESQSQNKGGGGVIQVRKEEVIFHSEDSELFEFILQDGLVVVLDIKRIKGHGKAGNELKQISHGDE